MAIYLGKKNLIPNHILLVNQYQEGLLRTGVQYKFVEELKLIIHNDVQQ